MYFFNLVHINFMFFQEIVVRHYKKKGRTSSERFYLKRHF